MMTDDGLLMLFDGDDADVDGYRWLCWLMMMIDDDDADVDRVD